MMSHLIAKFARGATTLANYVASELRRTRVVILYPTAKIDRTVRFGANVVVKCTDNGTLEIGAHTYIGGGVELVVRGGKLSIGPNGHIGRGSTVVCREMIKIGADCLVGEYVTIRDQDHQFRSPGPIRCNGVTLAPIVIGDNVWLGAKSTITRGTRIEENAVIGANAVVTHDVPGNSIAVGVPAKIIATYSV